MQITTINMYLLIEIKHNYPYTKMSWEYYIETEKLVLHAENLYFKKLHV